jgi:hypothetical protein
METGKANKYIGRAFNFERSEDYHLILQISFNQLTIILLNTNSVIEFYHNIKIENNLTDIFNNEKTLQLKYRKTTITFSNIAYTLVPNYLFVNEHSKEILEFSSDISDVIKLEKIREIDSTLIYSISEEIENLVSNFFPSATLKPQQSILIEQYIQAKNKLDNAYLFFNENILNITIFKDENLVFSNAFLFKTKEDILYYILFTFEQLKISTESVKVKLYGHIVKNDEIYKLLYDYIRNIEFGINMTTIKVPTEMNLLENHQLQGLFN